MRSSRKIAQRTTAVTASSVITTAVRAAPMRCSAANVSENAAAVAAPRRIGASLAEHAVGWQVGAAMLGALVLPSGVGFLAQRVGLAAIGPVTTAAAVSSHEVSIPRITAERRAT